MKRFALSAAATLGIAAFFALIAWLSGFNFDQRSPRVGEACLYIGMLAGFAGFATWSLNDD